MNNFTMYLANPRGFCAGVTRAIEVVEQALKEYPPPIYVKHEVVHNTHVVNRLTKQGVRFIEDMREVPPGSLLIFSAHGVSQEIRQQAADRNLTIYDATCPLVTKVHIEVQRYAAKGMDIILIGHANHPEVIGSLGQFKPIKENQNMHLIQNEIDATKVTLSQPDRVAYVTQTTLSVDDTSAILAIIKKRFPKIHAPTRGDICYATQNRQDAVTKLVDLCLANHTNTNTTTNSLIVVIGSPTSSNSNRLTELARARGIPAHLIEDASHFKPEWLNDVKTVGVSAGASAPEYLVQELIETLKQLGGIQKEFIEGFNETVEFSLPKPSSSPSSSPSSKQNSLGTAV